jgi:hypothetical protein
VNPLVPYNADGGFSNGHPHRALQPGGLPLVLSQTFRALIHSRMQVSSANYAKNFPGLDFVLFEPDRSDVELFFTNIFSYASRRRLCEHAYQKTRADLLARAESLAPILARHGIGLRRDILRDRRRTLVAGMPSRVRPVPHVVGVLEGALASLDDWLESSPVRSLA